MQTTCYGLFFRRADGGTPKAVKVLGDVVYWDLDDAVRARKAMGLLHTLDTLDIRQMVITVELTVEATVEAIV